MVKNTTLFEVAWEVCNKVGGIHTVVSTKALQACEQFGENYYLFGPDLGQKNGFEETQEPAWETLERIAKVNGLKCRFGRWKIPGRPKVILINFKDRYNQNQLLYELWQDYGVDSLTGGWDYVEPVMFSTACGDAIAAFYRGVVEPNEGAAVAQFHEWMCGAGILALKKKAPAVATVFTTHATMLGRSMAGGGLDIYAQMNQINPQREAASYNVTAKCSMEAIAAREADCFTTVSTITADEAAAFLSRRPDCVTPNGLDLRTIPDYSSNRTAPLACRAKILEAASRLLRHRLPQETRIVMISGRYEFHNKGIDLFLDAMAGVNKDLWESGISVLALCAVMGGHTGPDEAALSGDPDRRPEKGTNWITSHHVYDGPRDPILQACARTHLDNRPENPVQVLFIPAALDGQDGFLNLTYDEVLSACDLGAFPSWYEPWGYTPQEAAAFAVPTVTTDLSGFGQWARGIDEKGERGVTIIPRSRCSYEDTVEKLRSYLVSFVRLSGESLERIRSSVRKLAELSDWKIFYRQYLNAYTLAEENAAIRGSAQPSTTIDDDKLESVFSGASSTTPLLHGFTSTAKLPAPLSRLRELALNLWWTWHPEYWDLFRQISPALWESSGHNPLELFSKVDHGRFVELAEDAAYKALYDQAAAELDEYMSVAPGCASPHITPSHPVAYFSTEYGIHESLPIYSGGLGVLSGDHLKSASDLNIPLVGVGLLYKSGYFTQSISPEGKQVAQYPENNFRLLPVTRVKNQQTGEHLNVTLDFPGRTLYARVWKVQVGRIPLYLLDTDTPKNTEEDRKITAQLYVADRDTRIRQEIVLGMGGVRMLGALKLHPVTYHMNEGHSAFMVLERIRSQCLTRGLSFEAARELVRGDSVFTTHTPVDAGNEKFSMDLMHRYFDGWVKQLGLTWQDLQNLGCPEGQSGSFEMTLLALNHAFHSNGVSRLHGGVSRAMWQPNWKGIPTDEVPIGHITNGVHLASYAGEPVRTLLNNELDERWTSLKPEDAQWDKLREIPDEHLWDAKQSQKKELLNLLNANLPGIFKKNGTPRAEQRRIADALKEAPLIIGFARRFAPYKRAALIFADLKRLERILCDPERPVILVFAGKAHPADVQGAELIQKVIQISRQPEISGRIFFIENYNLAVARAMVQGCDVWLNTPRRPYEASGTSGMKAAVNGTLNLSVSDGWWCEGANGSNGWTIGPKVTSLSDAPQEQSDYSDAESLYTLLEEEIIPLYFSQDKNGIPHQWLKYVKNCIATLSPQFSSNRMVAQYLDECYSPAASRHSRLRADNCLLPRVLSEWKKDVGARFQSLKIDQVQINGLRQNSIACTEPLSVRAVVVPGAMKPEELEIQFVAGRSDLRDFTVKPDAVTLALEGKDSQNRLIYKGTYTPTHNGRYLYGIRALPVTEGLASHFDTKLIVWG